MKASIRGCTSAAATATATNRRRLCRPLLAAARRPAASPVGPDPPPRRCRIAFSTAAMAAAPPAPPAAPATGRGPSDPPAAPTANPEVTARLQSILTPALLRDVRDLWFEHLAGPDSVVLPRLEDTRRWFAGGDDFDQACIQRFLPALEAIRQSGATSGADILAAAPSPDEPLDWLSLVLLLDQMPRNCYRGDDKAAVVFSFFDPMARSVALEAIDQHRIPHGNPLIGWQFAYRNWFYLPLMHSEDLQTHDRALREYTRMQDDIESLAASDGAADSQSNALEDSIRAEARRIVNADLEAARALVKNYLSFEKKHYDIISRFGRYPHRNKALGRPMTDEEKSYLEGGGETFGAR